MRVVRHYFGVPVQADVCDRPGCSELFLPPRRGFCSDRCAHAAADAAYDRRQRRAVPVTADELRQRAAEMRRDGVGRFVGRAG